MLSYLIGLPLPLSIKAQLKSICCGLPSTEWIEEENFFLFLRHLGPLHEQIVDDVKEALSHVSFVPFTFSLKGINHSHKSHKGALWSGISPEDPVLKLKKEIDKALHELKLPYDKNFHPQVILGKYDNLSDHRLADYLLMHHLFASSSIEVSYFELLALHSTPKKTFYQLVERYP